MEERQQRPARHDVRERRGSPAFYLLLAGFIAGSFAGAAFGVLFALSSDAQHLLGVQSAAPTEAQRRAAAVTEDTAVIAAVKKVSPSVVNISVLKDVSKLYNRTGTLPFEFYFGLPFEAPQQAPSAQAPQQKQVVGGGTGFIISADGLILTNRHVVLDEEADYEVTLSDGQVRQGKVLARDTLLDIAVIKIEAQNLPVADLGDSDALQPGETVVAIGNALAELRNTITKGVVSGINRHVVAGDGLGASEVIEEAIQTDAAINPGNSGGPLIDVQGRVVGVNTAVNRDGQSIGFAIPINAAKSVIESVRAYGKIVRPWLGVRYVILTEESAKAGGLAVKYGALVSKGQQPTDKAVIPGSPAEKAGLAEGDVILEVDGVKIDSEHSLGGLIGRKKAGDAVTLKVWHQDEERTLTVILGELPDSSK